MPVTSLSNPKSRHFLQICTDKRYYPKSFTYTVVLKVMASLGEQM